MADYICCLKSCGKKLYKVFLSVEELAHTCDTKHNNNLQHIFLSVIQDDSYIILTISGSDKRESDYVTDIGFPPIAIADGAKDFLGKGTNDTVTLCKKNRAGSFVNISPKDECVLLLENKILSDSVREWIQDANYA